MEIKISVPEIVTLFKEIQKEPSKMRGLKTFYRQITDSYYY